MGRLRIQFTSRSYSMEDPSMIAGRLTLRRSTRCVELSSAKQNKAKQSKIVQ
jgi:hypothetical protein